MAHHHHNWANTTGQSWSGNKKLAIESRGVEKHRIGETFRSGKTGPNDGEEEASSENSHIQRSFRAATSDVKNAIWDTVLWRGDGADLADPADPVALTGEVESAVPRRSDRRSTGGRDSSWMGEALSAAASVFGSERESL